MSRCPHCHNRLVVPQLDDKLVVRVIEDDAPEPSPAEAPPAEDQRPVLVLTEDLMEPASVREAINALLQWRFMDVLRTIPVWGISIGIHAVALLALATFGLLTITTPKVAKRIFIPEGSIIIADLPKKMEDVDINRDARPDFADVLAHDTPLSSASTPMPNDVLGPSGSGEPRAMIGIEDPLAKPFGAGTGEGTPFGPGGPGSKVDYHGFEVSGAHSVVFIVDASGSMLSGEPGKTRWDLAIRELQTSIEKLSFGHLFNVYFARVLPGPNPFYLRWKEATVIANPANKEDCLKFIGQYDADMLDMGGKARSGQAMFGAGTDIIQATTDALKSSPDVIFLLSDAQFGELVTTRHNPADEIRSINRLHGVHIYTIWFKVKEVPIPGMPSAQQIMKRIADENRGRYKFIP